jgi:hypothetical protein
MNSYRKKVIEYTNGWLSSSSEPPDPIEILGSKVEFWFDNADASKITLVNTNEISTQTDQTGNFTRTPDTDTNGNRPTYDGTKDEIFFDGTVDGLVLQQALSAAAKAGGEIFVVMRRKHDYTGSPAFFGAYDTTTTLRNALLQDAGNTTGSNNSIRFFYRNGATVNTINGGVKILSDKIMIFNFRIDPGVEYILDWDNRGVIGETASTGANDGKWIDDLAAFNKVSFGMWQNGSTKTFTSYYEREFLYCNAILTSDERDDVYAYFNNKHNAYSTSSTNVGVGCKGQSNAQGQGADADRPTRLTATLAKPVKVWTATNTFSNYTSANDGGSDFGLDLSLLYSLSEYMKNADVYFVKVAVTGAPLANEAGRDDWNIANNELYPQYRDRCVEMVTALTALSEPYILIDYHIQGERDAREVNGGEPDAYYTNLNNLNNALVSAGFDPDYWIMNILHDGLVNDITTPTITEENLDTVNAKINQWISEGANRIAFDMNNYTLLTNDAHFPSAEYIHMGADMFVNTILGNSMLPRS